MQMPLFESDSNFPYGPELEALIFNLLLAIELIQASAASFIVEKSTVCEGSRVNATFILPYEEYQPQGVKDDGGYEVY